MEFRDCYLREYCCGPESDCTQAAAVSRRLALPIRATESQKYKLGAPWEK